VNNPDSYLLIPHPDSTHMQKVHFRYRVHPGDVLRNTERIALPNPETDPEGFLVQFLRNYTSDPRLSSIDEISKFIFDEFEEIHQQEACILKHGLSSKAHARSIISALETELKSEAYHNFYHVLLSDGIEITYTNEG
jgi:hypothetical protein